MTEKIIAAYETDDDRRRIVDDLCHALAAYMNMGFDDLTANGQARTVEAAKESVAAGLGDFRLIARVNPLRIQVQYVPNAHGALPRNLFSFVGNAEDSTLSRAH